MTAPATIPGHKVIDLVSAHPQGIRLNQLAKAVEERFGKAVKFQAYTLLGLDLDDLLVFLEARDKVRIDSDIVFAVETRACAA